MAIRTLTDLQKGGRLVGIISHVSELRERISARLEVIPGQRGSTAVFTSNITKPPQANAYGGFLLTYFAFFFLFRAH